MKKIIFSIVVIIFIVLASLKFIPYKKSTYESEQTNVKLKIPGFSFFKKESGETVATFTSFRSSLILKLELNDILSDYDTYICHNKKYYYDEKNDVTISEYGVQQGIIFNTFYITYEKGEIDSDKCSEVTDYKDLKYTVTPVNNSGYCYIEENIKYRDSGNNLNNLHYECFGNLSFQNGRGKMIYINDMLSYNWISMDTIIDFLNYQVEKKNITKTDYGKDILYKTNDFSLLKCNTNNKDIYIGDPNFKYKDDYCK